MTNRAPVLLAVATALLGFGMMCASNAPLVPEFVQTPDAVYPRAEAEFRITTTVPGGRDVRYVLDWGDGAIDTTNGWQSGDTVALRHSWQDAGGYAVRALAFVQEDPGLASEWTEPVVVEVLANGLPQAYGLEGPERTVPGAWSRFSARATDSDGDSVAVQFDFGGTIGAWTAFRDTGAWFEDSFKFSAVETVRARVRARDQKGSVSDWSDPLLVPVEEAGAVLWRWYAEAGTWGTPVVALDGADEVVYIPSDGYSILYGHDGSRVITGFAPDTVSDPCFNPHLAFCSSTGHIIASTESGMVCAFTPSLQLAWAIYPETVPDAEWDAPVVRGNRIYIWDGNQLWLHCIEDLGDTARVVGRSVEPIDDMECPPVIDPDGHVLVDNDGYIAKFTPDLDSMVWGEDPLWDICMSLVVDEDGTVYCGDERGTVASLTADGDWRWVIDLSGSVNGITISTDALYCVTDEGKVYRVGKDGQEEWVTSCPDDAMFEGTPILTRNGLLYAVDCEEGGVFCLRQDDGELLWYGWFLPDKAGRRPGRDEAWQTSAAILSNGNLVFSDWEGLVCVKGYEDGGLDTDAPWPKWQHDAHNTGSAGSRPGW